ncbi:glycosyltransferase [Paenibacillus allorhizosphaerae]|uniref:D-inositol-3-phosphate glycosyltransferase n=1 Tax=Paenibacillus allorhizosphaerae TaxID=2849866 RepID=A0ABN7TMW1_9BACL|nr:glycosyltransferase [Paenibacillus allorhizosphaerae]CAG7647754.1 D-inositol-3-phosphate glycosyltransferase [Paenibacillus allorhizosphaerae]
MNRIAVIRSTFLPISETFIYGEIRQMKKYDPYVFCRKRLNEHRFPHAQVHIDPRFVKLNMMLQNRSFQLIHARFAPSGIRMIPFKQKWKVPLVTSFHGYDTPGSNIMKKHRTSLQRLFKIGDCFTVPCQAMKRELIKHGCPADKIEVYYSGIDVEQFTYKERFFPEEGPVNIVYVGRLVAKKGPDVLIRAFRQVHRQFPQTKLIMIGDGRLRRRLQQLSKSLRLENHIEFKGALSHQEVAEQLEKAHLFCLPSKKDSMGNQEGIPNALKEAMACGLPVISTFHAGIPELIDDGINGHLVAENSSKKLADKLIGVIRQPETWQQLGWNARTKIESEFNRKAQIGKLEQLFDRIIHTHEAREREVPFFSVIIPTYNRDQYVGRAIESVLKQTYKDFEVIVVDDGSTDNTAKVVQSYDTRVRYVYQKNSGPSEARNTGIRFAKGQYVAFLDSDDVFLPNKLQRNKQYLDKNPNCRFLYSWYYDRRDGKKRKIVRNVKAPSKLNKFRYYLYKRKFTIRTSTAVIRRSCFDKVGLFNPNYRYSQDWDMWLRLARYYRGYCQKTPLAVYRRHKRKFIPSYRRHLKIRRTATKLYRWKTTTLHALARKYTKRRRYSLRRYRNRV